MITRKQTNNNYYPRTTNTTITTKGIICWCFLYVNIYDYINHDKMVVASLVTALMTMTNTIVTKNHNVVVVYCVRNNIKYSAFYTSESAIILKPIYLFSSRWTTTITICFLRVLYFPLQYILYSLYRIRCRCWWFDYCD